MCFSSSSEITETPPLARRKRKFVFVKHEYSGNTSACAEKTAARHSRRSRRRKHLRLRGENVRSRKNGVKVEETPPLARRKLVSCASAASRVRNTSACAEKTTPVTKSPKKTWKHLRLRGENLLKKSRQNRDEETPPLARRKPWNIDNVATHCRNTSACAEKTLCNQISRLVQEKHLRLRGENSSIELPP